MTDFIRAGGLKSQEDFEKMLRERFPAIAGEITDIEEGLLHLEMAVLAEATCRAIDSDNLAEVRAHLDFVDELFEAAGPDLANAVYVSYLEYVFLGSKTTPHLAARVMLSARLQPALAELEDYLKETHEWKTNNSLPGRMLSLWKACLPGTDADEVVQVHGTGTRSAFPMTVVSPSMVSIRIFAASAESSQRPSAAFQANSRAAPKSQAATRSSR